MKILGCITNVLHRRLIPEKAHCKPPKKSCQCCCMRMGRGVACALHGTCASLAQGLASGDDPDGGSAGTALGAAPPRAAAGPPCGDREGPLLPLPLPPRNLEELIAHCLENKCTRVLRGLLPGNFACCMNCRTIATQAVLSGLSRMAGCIANMDVLPLVFSLMRYHPWSTTQALHVCTGSII